MHPLFRFVTCRLLQWQIILDPIKGTKNKYLQLDAFPGLQIHHNCFRSRLRKLTAEYKGSGREKEEGDDTLGKAVSEQGLTSPPTQHRLSGRQFYRSKDPTNSIKVLKEDNRVGKGREGKEPKRGSILQISGSSYCSWNHHAPHF